MSRPLTGSGALITGGGGGFGRSAATRLARDGAPRSRCWAAPKRPWRSAAEWVTQNVPDPTPVQWMTGAVLPVEGGKPLHPAADLAVVSRSEAGSGKTRGSRGARRFGDRSSGSP